MIEVVGLRKVFGKQTRALDGVSFAARPGFVTGLLGPNGSGKSTTMRIIVGQERPNAGRASVDGKRLAHHPDPLRRIGAMLDPRSAHPARTARNHLSALAATHGLGRQRVSRVIEDVGLEGVDDRRVGTFSAGMRQRLGIAAALLGDPANLMLDEPINGLDPDGVIWFRQLCRRMADEGRTVLISSHNLSELELAVDRVVVMGRGKVLADASLESLMHAGSTGVRVRTPDTDRFLSLLQDIGADAQRCGSSDLVVRNASPSKIGDLACAHSLRIHELVAVHQELEATYLDLTSATTDYHSADRE